MGGLVVVDRCPQREEFFFGGVGDDLLNIVFVSKNVHAATAVNNYQPLNTFTAKVISYFVQFY